MYGQKPPMSSAAFKEFVKPMLSAGDAKILDLVSIDPQPLAPGNEGPSYEENSPLSGSKFIDNWREWERTLRLTIAKHRALKLKRENGAPVEPPILPTDAVAAAVKAVTETETPLEGEILLDKARWSAIDALVGFNYFNSNTIFAYLLKLILLERRESFNTEEGFAEYKSLYASILDRVQSGVSPVGEPK